MPCTKTEARVERETEGWRGRGMEGDRDGEKERAPGLLVMPSSPPKMRICLFHPRFFHLSPTPHGPTILIR